ncbi:MAG: energy transducer TonB [Neisseria sp.]|nr:energy transducer TonB [Neisseria sp.]
MGKNIMNNKVIFSALVSAVGLFVAQPSGAQVHFFQNGQEAAARVSGKVAMSFTIKADGSVRDARITRTSGNPATDSAALAWVQQQTMQPVMVNGEARDFRIVKEIRFSDDGMTVALAR